MSETVGARQCLELVRGLTSRNRAERGGWAVLTDDWFGPGGFDFTEDVAVAWVLAWAAVRETARRARALRPAGRTTGDGDRGPGADGRARPGGLGDRRSEVSPAEVDFYDDLVAARGHPGPDQPPGGGERSLGAAGCLELVRGLASKAGADRRAAATAVAARVTAGDLDAGESSTIATVLAWAVEVESTRARPVLLSALLVLAEDGHVPVRVLDRTMAHLAGARLDEVEEGFRTDLAAALRRSAG